MKTIFFSLSLLLWLSLVSCNKTESSGTKASTTVTSKLSEIEAEEISYDINGVTHRSYAAYNKGKEGPLPVVFVLPEWWGLNDYIKGRVRQLASQGYYAVAVDYYGESKVVETPEEAQKLASHFYQVPIDARRMFDAVKNKMAQSDIADYNKMAIIGYCFGGAQALNMGRLSDDFKGVVSFHGNLDTGIRAKNNTVEYLVLNGEADQFVTQNEIDGFKKEMDSAKAKYQFINYPGALHAFTNPQSTAVGKKFGMDIAYNQEADQKSWQEMTQFLARVLK